eukprot:3920329-Ditylum_brightwellii.AAC.1
MEIMLDTSASQIVVFCKEDFVPYKDKTCGNVIKGIAKELLFKGSGIFQYQLQADDGTEIVLKLKVYYVAISPQDIGILL